jgi:hypothetical protein
MRNRYLRVCLTIVVVQNVPLLMTESSMATGCDVSESDVTGSEGPLPFALPEICLELSRYTTLIFGFGGDPMHIP